MRWIKQLPCLRISYTLVGIVLLLILIHLGTYFSLLYLPNLYTQVSLSTSSIISWKLWTLFTYSLFHSPYEVSHLLANCLMLLYFGGRISHIFSLSIVIKIIGLGIITGGGTHLIYSIITQTNLPLIGISGGTYALLAALCTFASDSRFLGIKGAHLIILLILSTTFLLFLHPHNPISFFKQMYEFCNASHY